MGIKGLWTVLTPYSEKKSLHEIRGETVAVDLSGWVCDSQNVTDYCVQPKLYLRNLFFRTIYLLLADINPIFVVEGDAPDLKRDVMAARNAIQFRGAAPHFDNGAKNKQPDVGRKRFQNVLKECESLLKCMGVRCLKGRGEAEATCAQLNAQGLVDAVISQDSDCFAYGARRVYRNFSVSSAAGGGANQGSVDCYDAGKMLNANALVMSEVVAGAEHKVTRVNHTPAKTEITLNSMGARINFYGAFSLEYKLSDDILCIYVDPTGFGRNKMVALAMLCGCDYGVGACGSSINTAVAFIHTVDENNIIPRLISWVSEPDRYEELTRWSSAPGRCDRCGHVGRTHLKNGCSVCATHKGCNDLGHKAKVAEVKRELSLRSRALSCGMPFPEPKIMKEFLNTIPEEIDIDGMKTITPSLIQFMKLMLNKLEWSEKYCVVKFMPLLTKWHLQENVPRKTIKPITIKKKKNPRGVPSYEVVWEDIDGQYEAIITDDQFDEDEDPQSVWTTIERQDLMRRYYPEVVDAYEESIKKPPKEKKTRAKKKKEDDNPEKPKKKYTKKTKKVMNTELVNLSSSLRNLDLLTKVSDLNFSKANISVSVNKLKRKSKKKQKTIESFIAKKRKKSCGKSMNTLGCSFKNMPINYDFYCKPFPDNNVKCDDKENHMLSMLGATTDDVNESDLSDIIDNIVSRSTNEKTTKVNNNLVKLVFQNKFSTPHKSVLRKTILSEVHNYCSTPNGSPIRRNSLNFKANLLNTSYQSKVSTSFFFDKLTEDRDAFEMSLEYNKSIITVKDCDTTVDYSLPEVCL